MSDLRSMIIILEDESEEYVKKLVGINPKTFCEENGFNHLRVVKSPKEKAFLDKEFHHLKEVRNEIRDLAKAAEGYSV